MEEERMQFSQISWLSLRRSEQRRPWLSVSVVRAHSRQGQFEHEDERRPDGVPLVGGFASALILDLIIIALRK
jgi:hypothetical protein